MTVYEIVTEKIIEQLKQGKIPWQKPWAGACSGAYNRVTKRQYSLINQMLLSHDGEYASLKQWNSLGGKVKKGAHGEVVVFWKIAEVKEDDSETVKKIPLLRYYTVFHISQVEGVEPLQNAPKIPQEVRTAEQIKDDYTEREQIEIRETVGDRAFYSPTEDFIQIPARKQFITSEEFYGTLFHEMVHSTGHKDRLDRLVKNASFGSEEYSKEELIAEIGSASMLTTLKLSTEKTMKNTSAYIQSWINVLKNDYRFIVSAAGKAEKAVEYIMGEKKQEGENYEGSE